MSSFWDDFKDIFKTKSQKEEEKKNAVADALKAEGELVDKLKTLEDEYAEAHPEKEEPDVDKLFPKESGLKEMEYSLSSDEELQKYAEDSLAYGKASSQNALNEKYGASEQKLENSRDAAGESMEESFRKLEALYSELKKQAGDEAIKRGMSRSSVVLSQLDKLDGNKAVSAEEIQNAYADAIGAIDAKIGELETEKDNALGELDLKYASDLAKKIDGLKKERSATAEKMDKYNNTVREKETKYQSDREENVTDYLSKRELAKIKEKAAQAEYEKKYGYSGDKLQNYSKRYDMAYDFYTALSPEVAVEALKASPNMKYYLGNYYDKLMSVLGSDGTKKIYY